MSKPNITNGPWVSQLTRIYGGGKLLFTQDWWDSPEELKQAEANASLAAAAPEMFELLEAIVLSGKLPLSLYASVKKVLQKARGEA
ncbi:MAG: hypothetical protein IKZ46_02285 [Victivallales bacterium]|nr:hypothetical protein [Victivallales bacterium]